MTYHVQFPGLGLEFTLDRVAFTVFGMPIYWYGILIATGLALAIVFAFSHARRFGIDSDRMVDVILIGTVCAVIGGRAFYVATAPFEYASFAEMLDIRLGGVAIYGAVIAAFLSGYFACRWRKVPILPMFDLAGMGFLLGQGIGRWGNFVNIEAFGANTSLPWGMSSSVITDYLTQHEAELEAIGMDIDPNMPVHPTFLYESLWCLLGFAFIAWYTRRRKFDGELTLLYMMWYGAGRAVIEGLRTDSLMIPGTSLRASQVLAAAMAVVAAIIWIVKTSKVKKAGGRQLFVDSEQGQLIARGEFYKKKADAGQTEEPAAASAAADAAVEPEVPAASQEASAQDGAEQAAEQTLQTAPEQDAPEQEPNGVEQSEEQEKKN